MFADPRCGAWYGRSTTNIPFFSPRANFLHRAFHSRYGSGTKNFGNSNAWFLISASPPTNLRSVNLGSAFPSFVPQCRASGSRSPGTGEGGGLSLKRGVHADVAASCLVARGKTDDGNASPVFAKNPTRLATGRGETGTDTTAREEERLSILPPQARV